MKTGRKMLKADEAALLGCGSGCAGEVEFLAAADPKADGSGPRKFRMTIYTGALFAGHWYYGDVILDVAGFKPSRQDVAAMYNHYETVGFTTAVRGDAAKATITVEGQILDGDAALEPAAARIRNRIEQKFPFQASGRWQPRKIERVEAGQAATVNGKTVKGPITIFRAFDMREASFTEMGWDGATAAVAAKGNEAAVEIEETIMADGKKTYTMALVTALRAVFTAEKAIDLAAARPEAETLSDFAAEIGDEVKGLRAAIAAANEKATAAETALAAAKTEIEQLKKNPAVVQLPAGDPATPPPAAGTADALKAEWNKSAELQAEFPKVEYFLKHKGIL